MPDLVTLLTLNVSRPIHKATLHSPTTPASHGSFRTCSLSHTALTRVSFFHWSPPLLLRLHILFVINPVPRILLILPSISISLFLHLYKLFSWRRRFSYGLQHPPPRRRGLTSPTRNLILGRIKPHCRSPSQRPARPEESSQLLSAPLNVVSGWPSSNAFVSRNAGARSPIRSSIPRLHSFRHTLPPHLTLTAFPLSGMITHRDLRVTVTSNVTGPSTQ